MNMGSGISPVAPKSVSLEQHSMGAAFAPFFRSGKKILHTGLPVWVQALSSMPPCVAQTLLQEAPAAPTY
ncbi:MAG: hypothetical protein QG571_491, partial [Pseudomonadota bacterium]|nr:hypothetical protein [Pseudomonadota bacterium]